MDHFEKTVLGDYKSAYRELVEVVKKNNRVVPKILAKAKLPELMPIREKTAQLFQDKKIIKICTKCNGECCGNSTYRSLRFSEIIYFCAYNFQNNKKFELPEPDWQHLMSESRSEHTRFAGAYCLFHSPEGCLLKEYRPWLCLGHICHRLSPFFQGEKHLKLRNFREEYFSSLKNWSEQLGINYRIYIMAIYQSDPAIRALLENSG